jgi:hypothetical protein
VLDYGSEAPGWRVAPRENQRLRLEIGEAHRVASREPVAVGQDDVEVVDEHCRPAVSGTVTPGHVMHDRQLGVAGAEALDRLVRFELEHLDDELRVSAAQVPHCRRDERRLVKAARRRRCVPPRRSSSVASVPPSAASTRSTWGVWWRPDRSPAHRTAEPLSPRRPRQVIRREGRRTGAISRRCDRPEWATGLKEPPAERGG